MIYHRFYEAPEADVADLIANHIAGRLITVGADGTPHVGVFPFLHRAGCIEVHLAEGDEQLADLRRGATATSTSMSASASASTSSCVFEVGDVLAYVPSYWEDEHNASGADIYHRTVVMEGAAELVGTPDAVAEHLRSLLSRYQPEGRYVAVDAENGMYAGMLRRLTLVRLSIRRARSKFKLGQQRPVDMRQRIIAELRQRNRPADQVAAEAVSRMIAG
jgi:predicted FMN-binding regulatory protein PaiB